MKKRRFRWIIPALFLLVLCGCGNRTEYAEHSFFALDTYITMQADGPETGTVLEEIEGLIKAKEQRWSVTLPGSEVYAINHSGGEPVTVSEDTARLIDFALEQSRQANGALDLTIYPVLTVWGFTTGSYRVPPQEEINHLLPLVDYQSVQLRENTVTVSAEVQIDL